MHQRLLRVRPETKKTGQRSGVGHVVPEFEVVIVKILTGAERFADMKHSTAI